MERSVGDPHIGDHALIGVVVAVEDQRLQRDRRVAAGGWDAGHDGLEDLVDADPFLG